MKDTILVIDDEQDILQYCLHSLGERYPFLHVQNGKEGLTKLSEGGVTAVLLDRSFLKSDPSELLGRKEDARNEGIAILREIRSRYAILPVIMVTQYGDYAAAKEALASGATDFIEWGALTSDRYFLEHYLDRAITAVTSGLENLKQKYNAFGIIGSSQRMMEVFKAMEQYKDSPIPILIQGASGTGKELVAHALHSMGSRRTKPFVPVDCGLLTENLAESELFGHKKGSFTDAHEDKKGLFEMADEGTLFLDEVGNLSPNVQSKLLRFMETGELRRIGETSHRRINVRVVAATNSELGGKDFRQDLYWRLNGLKIILPTLNEHKEDIPELVHHFIAKYSLEYDRRTQGIATEALDHLRNENFQENNIRELETLMKRCVMTASDIITLGDIVRCREEVAYRYTKPSTEAVCSWIASGSNCPLMDKGTMEDLERAAILHRLELFKGQREMAAKSLGIGKSKFYQKLREYRLTKE
jgi:DNA-binding NtrC family response regulator